MEPVKFRTVDTNGNGVIDSIEAASADLFKNTLSNERARAFQENLQSIMSKLDSFNDGDGEIRTGHLTKNFISDEDFEGEKLKAVADYLGPLTVDLLDPDNNLDDEIRAYYDKEGMFSPSLYYYMLNKNGGRVSYHVTIDDLKSDVKAILENQFKKNQDKKFLRLMKNWPSEQSIKEKYTAKTISDIYENPSLYPTISVSKDEYDRWKTFAPIAGTNGLLDIHDLSDLKANAKSKKTANNNFELESFLNTYGINGVLDWPQQNTLNEETKNNRNGHGFQFFGVGGKPSNFFKTSTVNQPGFKWNWDEATKTGQDESYSFYNLYDDFFIKKGLYEGDDIIREISPVPLSVS